MGGVQGEHHRVKETVDVGEPLEGIPYPSKSSGNLDENCLGDNYKVKERKEDSGFKDPIYLHEGKEQQCAKKKGISSGEAPCEVE